MSTIVIDTSVTLAWYLNESFSKAAREWHERIMSGHERCIAPSLHFLEFANALRTLTIRREIASNMARLIMEAHMDAPIEVVEPDLREVLSTSLEYDATAYDAAFISVAIAHDATLVTAERTTTHWVQKLGKRVAIVR